MMMSFYHWWLIAASIVVLSSKNSMRCSLLLCNFIILRWLFFVVFFFGGRGGGGGLFSYREMLRIRILVLASAHCHGVLFRSVQPKKTWQLSLCTLFIWQFFNFVLKTESYVDFLIDWLMIAYSPLSWADSLRLYVGSAWVTSFYSAFFEYPPKWCTYSAGMAGATWNCSRLGASPVYTIQPCTMSLHAKPHT